MTTISSQRAKQQAAAGVLHELLDHDLTALLWRIGTSGDRLDGQFTGDKADLDAVLKEYADHFGAEVVRTESLEGHEPAFIQWKVNAKVDEVPVCVWGLLYRSETDAPAETETETATAVSA